jgi:hypothetical protein
VHYASNVPEYARILCDGCGQPADAAHLARRLKRLENMTRYRPIHVQALFLGAASPADDQEYLYSAQGEFAGQGVMLLRSLAVESAGRTVEATLADFQRRGYLLAHLLDCSQAFGNGAVGREELARRLPAMMTRIRRSFRPKRVLLLGHALMEFIPQFMAASLDATLVLRAGEPFEWNEITEGELAKELAAPLQPL